MRASLRQETPSESTGEPTRTTTNYSNKFGDLTNENFAYIIVAGFALFLFILIRRAFRR